MISFINKHQNLSIFILYFTLSIIILLPAIFLITQNLALNLDIFSFDAKYFEVIKLFQNLNSQNIVDATYDIFSPLSIGYLFHLFFSEPLGFNLFLILFFPFGSFAGYLLVNYLTQSENKLISVFTGILFGIASIVCYPLILILYFIYFLLKALEKLSIKFGFLAALFYLFICSYNLFFAITTLFLSLIIILFALYPRIKQIVHNQKDIIKILSFILLLIVIFSLKYYWPLKQTEVFDLSNQFFAQNSLDIYSIIPNSIFNIQYLILDILILFLIIFFTILALRIYKTNKWVIFSFILSIIFLIFSFGPYLIFQQNIISPKINLPYLFLYRFFPFFNQTLDIKSFLIFSLIFFIVFISFGLKFFFEKIKISKNIKKISFSLIFLLILFGSWLIWQPGPEISSFYKNLNKQDNIIYLSTTTTKPGNILYQNSENKNNIILSPKISNDNFGIANSKTPVQSFANNLPQNREINFANFIQPNYEKTFSQYLFNNKIKYIVFDCSFIKKTKPQRIKIDDKTFEEKKYQELLNFNKIINFLKNNTEGNWQTVNDNLIYEITGPKTDQITIYQGENWGKDDYDPRIFAEQQKKVNIKGHWMINDSTLFLENPTDKDKEIELYLNLKTENELRILEIYLNNTKITDLTVANQPKAYLVDLKNIKPGQSTITFKAKDFDEQILDITENNKTKSILFNAIKFQEINNNEITNFYEGLDVNTKILTLPVEIDSLKDNPQFLSIQDLINQNTTQISDNPLLNKLFFDNLDLRIELDIFDKDYYYSTGQSIINRYNIRYIAIEKDWLNEKEYSSLAKFIINNFDLESIPFNDSQIIVLQIKPKEINEQPSMSFLGNWRIAEWEKQTDRFFIVLHGNSQIVVNNQEANNINAHLSFKAENFDNEPRIIRLYLNSDWLEEKELKEIKVLEMKVGQEQNIKIELPDLRLGENEVIFKVFDEKNNDIIINKGIRLSKFKIEKTDSPIDKINTITKEFCDETNRQIFEKYNYNQEFSDSFEDENFTRENWINKPWELMFNQDNSFQGRQSLKFFLNQGEITKELYGCFAKLDLSLRVKANKWLRGANLNINLIGSNKKNQNINIPFPDAMINFTNTSGEITKYPGKFDLAEWNELKIIKDNETIEFWENNNLIFQLKDPENIYVQNIKINPFSGYPKNNLDIFFDKVELNLNND